MSKKKKLTFKYIKIGHDTEGLAAQDINATGIAVALNILNTVGNPLEHYTHRELTRKLLKFKYTTEGDYEAQKFNIYRLKEVQEVQEPKYVSIQKWLESSWLPRRKSLEPTEAQPIGASGV